MDAVYYTLNPWWEGKDIETGIRRDAYLDKIPTYLARKQIEVFIGSRRTGKTTLLKQFIKTLLQTAVPGKDIFYLALDHPILSGISNCICSSMKFRKALNGRRNSRASMTWSRSKYSAPVPRRR